MKKAFTLIELLVVIAIIAILAAILFPVFAQAKVAAKKTQALSNVKQISTSQAIYSTDYDDLMPISYSIRANGTVRWSTIVPFPANGITNGGWETVIPEVEMQWASSMQPYIKNKQMFESGLQTTTSITGDTYHPNAGTSGLTMNGMLSQYSGTAISNVAVTPAFWTGMGSWQYKGRAFANPALRCNSATAAPCQFNPGGSPQSGAVPSGNNYSAFFGLGTGWKVWTYGTSTQGGGVLMAYADTHAKSVRVGTALSPAFHTRGDTDPYALVGTTGSTFSYWTTSTGDCSNPGADTGTIQYLCYFRPDREQ